MLVLLLIGIVSLSNSALDASAWFAVKDSQSLKGGNPQEDVVKVAPPATAKGGTPLGESSSADGVASMRAEEDVLKGAPPYTATTMAPPPSDTATTKASPIISARPIMLFDVSCYCSTHLSV